MKLLGVCMTTGRLAWSKKSWDFFQRLPRAGWLLPTATTSARRFGERPPWTGWTNAEQPSAFRASESWSWSSVKAVSGAGCFSAGRWAAVTLKPRESRTERSSTEQPPAAKAKGSWPRCFFQRLSGDAGCSSADWRSATQSSGQRVPWTGRPSKPTNKPFEAQARESQSRDSFSWLPRAGECPAADSRLNQEYLVLPSHLTTPVKSGTVQNINLSIMLSGNIAFFYLQRAAPPMTGEEDAACDDLETF